MRWLAWLVLGVLFAGALATVADARPGGGHSYSGGSSRSSGGGSYRSSSSSSGGGGGDLGAGGVMAIIVGVVLVVVVLSISSNDTSSATIAAAAAAPVAAQAFVPLVTKDPAFSQVAFEDFAFQLYARVKRARGKPELLAELTPYVASDLLRELEHAQPVAAVVIGSLRIVGVVASMPDIPQTIEVRIEANLANPTITQLSIERWTFSRSHDVMTRAPDRTRTFPCPSCNAPFARGAAERTCAHCNTDIAVGRFEWTLTAITPGTLTNVGPTLTGTVEEVGTDLMTQVEPDAFIKMQELYEADKNVSWTAFEEHVAMIYAQLNAAWNAQDLKPVRGLVTSSLLGYLQYWVDEYKRQQMANKLESAKISRIALAKVTRDPYFDAVTVRVFADGNDFTIGPNKNVVGGSKTSRRAYSEYWTLIRSATRRGPIVNEAKCPNCGAPTSISDAGACTHCNAEVENGSFDWVLSKIEQDEVYLG